METKEFVSPAISWKTAFHLRVKQLFLDLTSTKVWVLGAVLVGIFFGVIFDPWFYIFAAVVLGLKDMSKMILAFRGKQEKGDV